MERGSYLSDWISQGSQGEQEKMVRYSPPVSSATSIISTLVSAEVLRASRGILRSLVAEGILLEGIVLYGLGHWRCLVAIAMAILRAVSGAPHLQEPLSVFFFVKRHFEVVRVVQEGLGQWKRRFKESLFQGVRNNVVADRGWRLEEVGRRKDRDRGKIKKALCVPKKILTCS